MGILIRMVRLKVRVLFQAADDWNEDSEAMLDTGSCISVIPKSIWEEISYRLLSNQDFNVSLAGETTAGKLGEVVIRVHDNNVASYPITLKALLLWDNTHPLVLGFEDILTEASLFCNYAQSVAYLEFPVIVDG